MTVRILITGSRKFTDRPAIAAKLSEVYRRYGRQQLVVVNGDARGADSISRAIADSVPDEQLLAENYPVTDADWYPNGRSQPMNKRAGHIRNAVMVAAGAELCLAFMSTAAEASGGNRGTKGCIAAAERARIPVEITWG
jgi:hypothetical protein